MHTEGNIIQPSSSNYSSPVFVKEKRSGELRILGDFRKHNSITQREDFPYPDVRNMFIDLLRSKIFSQIDLKMGFHQVKIDPKDTHKTAFSALGRKYEYVRIPICLKNAGFAFQRIMTSILGDLP